VSGPQPQYHSRRKQLQETYHLDVLFGFNAFTTVMQVFKRFALLIPFKFLFTPLAS
jgi:hypothetical protein